MFWLVSYLYSYWGRVSDMERHVRLSDSKNGALLEWHDPKLKTQYMKHALAIQAVEWAAWAQSIEYSGSRPIVAN